MCAKVNVRLFDVRAVAYAARPVPLAHLDHAHPAHAGEPRGHGVRARANGAGLGGGGAGGRTSRATCGERKKG